MGTQILVLVYQRHVMKYPGIMVMALMSSLIIHQDQKLIYVLFLLEYVQHVQTQETRRSA